LLFIDFFTTEVIVAIPFLIKRVLGVAHIVAESKMTIVIDDAVEVVTRFNLELLFDEFSI